jgi:hypothetical protein
MDEIGQSHINETPQLVRPSLGCNDALDDASGDALYTSRAVSTHPASQSEPEHLELSVEELLRRVRPMPDHMRW